MDFHQTASHHDEHLNLGRYFIFTFPLNTCIRTWCGPSSCSFYTYFFGVLVQITVTLLYLSNFVTRLSLFVPLCTRVMAFSFCSIVWYHLSAPSHTLVSSHIGRKSSSPFNKCAKHICGEDFRFSTLLSTTHLMARNAPLNSPQLFLLLSLYVGLKSTKSYSYLIWWFRLDRESAQTNK